RQGINLDAIKTKFLDGSRPLMPFTNILTFNTRAICLYISCLIDKPWIYPLFEITVMYTLYIYMHRQHEKLCHSLSKEMSSDT
ncbi:MAG: CDP-alcohol phosphatidyltransferase family protein, partial [Prevotella sp.]|nr:CDP-alcohol phosphatidyltransferase family protein [Prevotella sp.]